MRSLILNFYSAVRLPGIVLHEISHLLFVFLIPGIRVESIDLTSEIEHSGNYTGFRMFLISYAPVLINSVFAYVIVSYEPFIETSEPLSAIISVASIFLAFSLLLGVTPSYVDAMNPVKMAYANTKSNPVSLAPLYMPLILTVSLPFILVTYVSEKWLSTTVLFEVFVAGFMILVFAGLLDINELASSLANLDAF